MRTYVIRLQEPRPGDDGELHGVAEDISTGRQVRFSNGAQLLEVFMSRDRAETDRERSGQKFDRNPEDLIR
jgi:hypothetical protein